MPDEQTVNWPPGLSISHLEANSFEVGGLRTFFDYRDLGIANATNGRVVAHVIRANDADVISRWHWHDVDVQIVYVLKGWIEFEYAGVGNVRLEPGSCVHQAPRIRHRELAHSPDLELLEIVSPADFGTHTEDDEEALPNFAE